MHLQLKKPELERFIDEQVDAGFFPNREAAVEQMMRDQESSELDDETAAAINRAEEQIDAGYGIDFKQFAAEMRTKFTN
jgi:Arc/MetJ-type ribon-helix-helix transcriptional regulator